MFVRTPLSSNWQYAQLVPQATPEWAPVTQFPTSVHVELLKAKKIPDPFVGLDEWDVQWVGEADWLFRTTFKVTQAELSAPNADIVFEGLDTFAIIELNGRKLIETNNMFLSYRVPVKDTLKLGENELLLTFPSAFLKGRDLEKRNGKGGCWNGDSSRLHVRKAQYNYGWDWGPVLMTAGPWRPISLETYTARISDLWVRANVSEELDAEIDITLESTAAEGDVSIVLRDPSGKVKQQANARLLNKRASVKFSGNRDEFELWYPVGYGKQPIYSIEVQIADENGNVVASQDQRIGIRRARVVQEKLVDAEGLSFLFEVNNVRIFAAGSNWIPADSFLTMVSPQMYRAWLQLLVDGNQNMIRVWGGGIYEEQVFYDICDELGILVWQDFMFGCGQYPAYDDFLDQVSEEAEFNVKRLRHHPSLVIFAGNNEDYQLAESMNLELDYSDEISDYRKTNFPARYIYERTLPEITNKFSDVFYHRSSPYSGQGKPTTDRTLGDIHQWNVWHGSQEPWHNWDILSGRFVSEFGMEGYPNIRTVDFWLGGNKEERYPQSRINNNHNKADGFERRLELYLIENFKHSFDMESYIYFTQIMQAEALAAAYRLWRREWRGKGKEYTAGALVWQLNDCWPVTSWAIVDYFLRPKPAYFTIARELRPYTVGITRQEKRTFANDRTAASFSISSTIEVWGTNSTVDAKRVTLDLTAFDLDDETWSHSLKKEVVLAPNSSTEVMKDELPGQPTRTRLSEKAKPIVVSARLLDNDGTVLARYSNWPEPFKYVNFPDLASLRLKIAVAADGETVELSTAKPVKGIVLDVDGEEVKWSDQAIDLVPGDPQIVKAIGLKGRPVKARFLGDGTA